MVTDANMLYHICQVSVWLPTNMRTYVLMAYFKRLWCTMASLVYVSRKFRNFVVANELSKVRVKLFSTSVVCTSKGKSRNSNPQHGRSRGPELPLSYLWAHLLPHLPHLTELQREYYSALNFILNISFL